MNSRRYSNCAQRGGGVHIPDKCVTETLDEKVTAREKGKTFEVLNPNGKLVRKVRVDGCVVTDSATPRCDYLFEVASPLEQALYVEFKGKDLERACKQLADTLKLFADRHRGVPRHCYVVSSRVPSAGTKPQVLASKFFKENKASIRFKGRKDNATV